MDPVIQLVDAPDAGDEHIAFPCPQCGSSLEFKPGADAMHCAACGHTRPLRTDGAAIHEHDFQEALARARRLPSTALVPDGRTVQCSGCGAQTVVSGQAARCPFCGAPVVIDAAPQGEQFAPESLLPFKLSNAEARAAFDAWLGGLWFAPNDLKNEAHKQGLDGVYLPYWTYDSQTTTHYTGSRGEHYYVTTSYTDSKGHRRTRTTRRTRWYPASGTVQVPFDDMLVCASDTMPRTLVEKLEPWDLAELKPFDPAYLSGFVAERYRLGLEAGFGVAEERMTPEIRGAVRRDIGGDTQRIATLDVNHAQVRFKHLLLPLWLSSFKYNEKIYRFVVNARTGEVAGERPWSAIKIAAFTLTLIAIGTAIGLLIYYNA